MKSDNQESLGLFNIFIFRLFTFLALWNIAALTYSLVITLSDINPSIFPNSYGDYERSDLFYTLIQGNFENPYKIHEEIPSLTSNAYLPGFYLLLDLLGIQLHSFGKNLLWVHITVLAFMAPIVLLFWKMQVMIPKKIKIVTTIGAAILSVPSIYLFTTGNIQALVVGLILFFFLPEARNKEFQRFRDIAGTTFVAFVKPQFLIVVFYGVLKSKTRAISIFIGVAIGTVVSLFGFWHFGDVFESNVKYWFTSVRGFVSAKPSFMVHNNASVIGNLSSIELWFWPESINTLYSLHFSRVIILITVFVVFFLLYKLYKIPNVKWLSLWLIVSLSTLITPVSFNYNLALFLIPLAVLFGSKNEILNFVEMFLVSYKYKLSFIFMIFFTFGSKPLRVWLVQDVADTNLFNMMNSFGLIGAMILCSKVLKAHSRRH